MEFILNIIYGAIIGVANIIPGVSGGTMAVILNIYDALIGAVSNLRKDFKKNVLFLLPIGIGAGLGIILFSKLIEYFLKIFPMQINFFFMGLIIGSIPMIYKRATHKAFKPVAIIPFIITFLIMVGLSFLGGDENTGVIIDTITLGSAVKLVICGAVAAACAILPGVSGSLILLVLGVYTSIVVAILSFNIPVLMFAGIGVLIGLVGGAKLIDVCLKKDEQLTFFGILGLVVGSIIPVFKASQFEFSVGAIGAVVVMLIGAAITLIFASEKFQALVARKNK